MLPDSLIEYLFDGRPHPLAEPLAGWLAESRRFAAFAATFRDKIRKKIRTGSDAERGLDLLLELETAYLLLGERALSLVYEPKEPGQSRSPDFAVTFTTSLTFLAEVTRIRPEPPGDDAQAAGQRLAERAADAVCGKLGQLLPQRSNVLIIGAPAPGPPADALRAALLQVQQRAERNDAALFQRHHLRDRADFFQRFQRLSELVVRAADGSALAWVNPQARHPLPAKARTALRRSHGL
ncbi:MAG TPA: hypothetical protein VGE07_23190 [Herpetosiphonaceae bacterium]